MLEALLLAELGPGDLPLFVLVHHGLLALPLLVQGVLVLVLIGGGVHLGLQVLLVLVLLALQRQPVVKAADPRVTLATGTVMPPLVAFLATTHFAVLLMFADVC